MREIKFRVWEKTTKNIFPKWGAIAKVEMDECGKITQVGVAEYTQIAEDEFDWNLFEIKNEENNIILMQYTGLKDKNGKEIYEGDIVEFNYVRGFDAEESHEEDFDNTRVKRFKKQVKFCSGEFTPREEGYYPDDGFYGYRYWDFEVIGNIYENPELLRRDV